MSSDEKHTIGEWAEIVVFAVTAATAVAALDIFATMKLWNWFMTRIGLPEIDFLMAMGLSLAVAMFLPAIPRSTCEKEHSLLIRAIAKPIIALAIGWILNRAMIG